MEDELDPNTTTIAEGKAWLLDRVDDGENCPLCTQFAKVYRRKPHATMARDLIVAWQKHGTGDFHAPTLHGNIGGGDFAKLVHWGLISGDPSVRDDGSTRNGWWRVTDRGVRFCNGRLEIPKYARIYDGACLSLDDSEHVNIYDCLGSRFNYRELMDGE
jgi:hypothetical protein